MRIIAGRFRGLTLAGLGKGDPAAHLRPTSDRVRESLFSHLGAGQYGALPQGARVLDLFAGTGALGLEALSRGAAEAVFVENGAKAAALIRANIARTRCEDETRLIRRDATRLGTNEGAGFDLIFLDPPYGKGMGERAVTAGLAGGWLAPGAIVVWEESRPPDLPPALILRDQRRHGDSIITVAEYKGSAQGQHQNHL